MINKPLSFYVFRHYISSTGEVSKCLEMVNAAVYEMRGCWCLDWSVVRALVRPASSPQRTVAFPQGTKAVTPNASVHTMVAPYRRPLGACRRRMYEECDWEVFELLLSFLVSGARCVLRILSAADLFCPTALFAKLHARIQAWHRTEEFQKQSSQSSFQPQPKQIVDNRWMKEC